MIISREALKKYPIVGEGGQGIVYRIDEKTVVKLSENVNIELLKTMSLIELKQFLKPIEEVYEDKEVSKCYAFVYPYMDKQKQTKAYLLER